MSILKLGYAQIDVGKLFLILSNLFGSLESFAFEECGQFGFFFYSDGNCYFFRPNNLTGAEDCQKFDQVIHEPFDRLQGLVMEKGGNSYFWSTIQQGKAAYYVKPHKSNMIQEKKCPGNSGAVEVQVFLTLSEICLTISRERIFVNGMELKDVERDKLGDEVMPIDAESPIILLLIRSENDLKFFYTNNDTTKSGEISMKLPQGYTLEGLASSFQTCKNESFILIQNEESKQIQIYVYSIPKIIRAVEQGDESYPLDLTHSLQFKSLLKEEDMLHSIMIRYPYKLRAFMFVAMDESKWYLIIPDIPYSAHIVTGCNIQDGRNGTQTGVCSESFSPSFELSPFVHLGRLGVHTAFKNLSGLNATFKFESHFVTTCYLMNDCYGCRLADPSRCSWDGEKCIPSSFQESFKKCISLRNIIENNGALEINVKGVRLTNTFMKVHILAPDEYEIKPVSIHDHEAVFQLPNSILANWAAGNIDLFLVIDNEIIENSVVRLNLRYTGKSPLDYELISWLIVLIMIILLLIFAFRKLSQYNSAPQSSATESLTASSTQSNLFGVSNSPVEFSVFARDKGFRASRTSILEETIKRGKELSDAKNASTQSSVDT